MSTKGFRSCLVGVAILVWAVVSSPGCTSSIHARGVQRVTPRGQDWSHVTGISWSPDGSRLALTWVRWSDLRHSEGYIYTIGVEGNEPQILSHTKAEGWFGSPAWSPSNQIAFASDGWSPTGIWLVDASDEGEPTFLGGESHCAWAPDSEQIALPYTDLTTYTIYTLNTRTGERRQVFQISGGGRYAFEGGISWSPAGDRLAFALGFGGPNTTLTTNIYVLDLASGHSWPLTEGGSYDFPSWSPDGMMLAFSGGEALKRTLVIMRLSDGSTIQPLDAVDGIGPVAWSPDGSKIAFEWKGDVYTIDTSIALAGWSGTEGE